MSDLSNYQMAREKAQQQYDSAFHLLKVTYPLARDEKLLLGVLFNLFSSLESSMTSILAYERQLHLVPAYLDNFQSKFNLFRYKSLQRNKIPEEYALLMTELQEMIELQKKCPVEFQRGNRLVMCTKDYEMKTLSLKEIQDYLGKTKDFLELSQQITSRIKEKL